VSFLEKEFARASDEIATLKDCIHKRTSEMLDCKEQMFIKEQENEKTKYEMNAIQRQLDSMTKSNDHLTTNIDEIRGNNNKLIMKSNMLNKLLTDKDVKLDEMQTNMQNMQLKMEDYDLKMNRYDTLKLSLDDFKKQNVKLKQKLINNNIKINDDVDNESIVV
jgi:chromosome segregation ATPase